VARAAPFNAALRVAEFPVLMTAVSPDPPRRPPQLLTRLSTRGRQWLGVRQLNHLVRFEPVLGLVLAAGGPGTHLLDVGSGSQGISTLLPEDWRVTAVDADFADYAPSAGPRRLAPNQQLGDVRELPFADRSFDVTVAVDLLEHVPSADRVRAVGEICRVSRRRAVIACPAGEAALSGDRRLAARLRSSKRPIPPWLTEHLDNGFPEADDIARAAAPFGTVEVFANESVRAHERLVMAELSILPAVGLRLLCRPLQFAMTSQRRRLRTAAAQVLARVRDHDREPAYRAIVVMSRDLTA
jgi:SAM-dependent methyltransferase